MKKIDLSSYMGKDINEVIKLANNLSIKNLEDKINAHFIYNSILDIIPNQYNYKYSKIRGDVNQKIWEIERHFNWNQNYHSQSGQDKCVKEYFFKNKKNGYFVEIGAYDGVTGSNCLFFENVMQWKGIAIEPSPSLFTKLKKNRKCECLNIAVSNKQSKNEFVEVINGYTQMGGLNTEEYNDTLNLITSDPRTKMNKLFVKTINLNDLIKKNNVIDYLSIDVEGEEMRIIESIDYKLLTIKVLSIENNSKIKKSFYNFLKEKNFEYFDTLGKDEIYYNKNIFNI